MGAPDERLGQRVVAIVVGTATAEELDAAAASRPRSPASRRPRDRFVDVLPRSAAGKILRRLLRDEEVRA